jgi:hypothetical protein
VADLDVSLSGPVGVLVQALSAALKAGFEHNIKFRDQMADDLRRRMDVLLVRGFERLDKIADRMIDLPDEKPAEPKK